MKTRERYQFIIKYQAKPLKGKERKLDKKLDTDIKRLLKSYGYKFIGSGFDFTNEFRDMEFWFVPLTKERV